MASFTVNRGAMRAHIFSRSTSVNREFVRRADRVVSLAKVYVPVDTGRLKSMIGRSDPIPTPNGLKIVIYALTDYAAAVHEGRGSKYAPRSWRRRGPGPRRFLTNALSAAGGRQTR